ncbi:MAG: hypothetical protein EBX53_09415, partial [Betaproteobacteria bacterium]|nr:hypothetical protein [Betaproteobacteria bacterium]
LTEPLLSGLVGGFLCPQLLPKQLLRSAVLGILHRQALLQVLLHGLVVQLLVLNVCAKSRKRGLVGKLPRRLLFAKRLRPGRLI